jgi:regulator of sigma E protease
MIFVIAFIVTIGILVTIHEFGHFQVARWCGVRVLRFSIGFGKPLWIKKFGKDQTEFVLAAIPLGGFVKMLDEREIAAEREENPQAEQVNYSQTELTRAFNRQAVWKRIAIVIAGPLANLLLAIALYWLLIMQGEMGLRPIIDKVAPNSLAAQASLQANDTIQSVAGKPVKTWQEARWLLLKESLENETVQIATLTNNELREHTLSFAGISNDPEIDVLDKIGVKQLEPKIPAIIGEILPKSAAEKAGLKLNDEIIRIDALAVNDWQEVVKVVTGSVNRPLQFTVMREHQQLTLAVTPEAFKQNSKTIGRIGAGVKINQAEIDKALILINYSPLESLQMAVARTWDTSIFSLKMFGKMIMGKVSLKSISGPATIAQYAGESASIGLEQFLKFLALVSISIGVLNLLPIPVLDGGHLMYYITEILKGSPVSEKTMLVGQKIGFSLLGLLMTIAIFNDFNRLLFSS